MLEHWFLIVAHWNNLGSFEKYWYLDGILRDADVIGLLGCSLCIMKFF